MFTVLKLFKSECSFVSNLLKLINTPPFSGVVLYIFCMKIKNFLYIQIFFFSSSKYILEQFEFVKFKMLDFSPRFTIVCHISSYCTNSIHIIKNDHANFTDDSDKLYKHIFNWMKNWVKLVIHKFSPQHQHHGLQCKIEKGMLKQEKTFLTNLLKL